MVDGHLVLPAASIAGRSTKLRGCLIGLVLVGLFVLGTGVFAFLAGDGDRSPPASPLLPSVTGAAQRLYPNRPDALPSDQERRVGEAAEISGVLAAVTASDHTPSEGVVADVVLSAPAVPRPYSAAHWKLRALDGRLLDVSAAPVTSPLGSGEVPAAGTVSGRIAFDVGGTPGVYYLIWAPDPLSASRGVWEVTVD